MRRIVYTKNRAYHWDTPVRFIIALFALGLRRYITWNVCNQRISWALSPIATVLGITITLTLLVLFKPLLIFALACHALSILLFTFSERFTDRAFSVIHDAGWYVGQILELNDA